MDAGAQSTLTPSSYKGGEPICISGVKGESQKPGIGQISLIGNDWQKHPIVTGPEATCIVGIGYLSRVLQGPKWIMVGLQHSCLGDREQEAAVCLAWSLRPFCYGVAKSRTPAAM